MKKRLRKVMAFLLASVMLLGSMSLTAFADTEEGYLMFLAYGGESEGMSWNMCYANEADNASGIVATTAYVNAGDTVTIGVTLPETASYTWYMAPVIIAEGVTNVSYTVDSVTIDGEEIIDDIDFTLGDKEWWYETTGNYSDTEAIRLKGGYNEWADKYIAESPVGMTEIMYTITVNGIDFAESDEGGKGSADEGYTMFLGYGGEVTEGAWDMCWANEADYSGEIVPTIATAKVGDTVTIGLTFPQAATYTWWMAPVILADGVTELDYTIESVTLDGKDILGDIDLTLGDKEWWYENTGNFSDTEAIRLKGGYNEWADKYIAESPVGMTEVMYTITLNSVVTGESASASGDAVASTESYPAFIAIGADVAGSWDLQYYGEDSENTGEVVAVNGELKNGETTTLSITAPAEIAYTWFVAPCMIVEDSSVISQDSTFDVKVYLDGEEIATDLSAGKSCWAEGTGAYDETTCVRIAGGYNEWGDKYIAEAPTGYTTITFEITPNILLAAGAEEPAVEETTGAASGLEFDANGTYNAYICIQSANYSFRNAFNETTYGSGTEYFDQITGWNGNDPMAMPGTLNDVVIEGNGTYEVSITGLDLSGETAGASETLNLLFISTDIPLDSGVTISNVEIKMGGKSVYDFEEAFLDPDEKEYIKPLFINIWNKELTAEHEFAYTLSAGMDVVITFEVDGFAYDNASATVEEPTTTAAASTSTEPTTAASTEPADDGGFPTGLVVGIVAAIVVVAVVVVVVLKKKKA